MKFKADGTPVKDIYDHFTDCTKQNATLRTRVASLEAALEEIRTHYGKVCHEFETCQHPACSSSYGAWAVADEALRAQVSP